MAVAGTQLAVCVPVLLFGHDRSAPLHVAHEMGSFEVAIAVGFLVAAYRPARAAGMVSLVGAAATLLVVTAALDLAANRTDLSDEAPHLIVVVGWLLLWRLAAVTPPSWERPRSALTAISGMWDGLTQRSGASAPLDVSDSAEPGRGVASALRSRRGDQGIPGGGPQSIRGGRWLMSLDCPGRQGHSAPRVGARPANQRSHHRRC